MRHLLDDVDRNGHFEVRELFATAPDNDVLEIVDHLAVRDDEHYGNFAEHPVGTTDRGRLADTRHRPYDPFDLRCRHVFAAYFEHVLRPVDERDGPIRMP